MKRSLLIVCSILLSSMVWAQDKPAPDKPTPEKPAKPESKSPAPKTDSKDDAAKSDAKAGEEKSPLDFQVKDIDDTDVKLSSYKGKVVMIVNVASKCGLTPQYEQLQQLHERFGERGLAILAFPANNFLGQEPGTNKEIKEFCASKYGVGFELFSKVSVKGDDICGLYKWLTSKEKNASHAGEIKWNFTKFLIDREGKVINRFEPKTKPDAKEVIEAIEKALGDKKD